MLVRDKHGPFSLEECAAAQAYLGRGNSSAKLFWAFSVKTVENIKSCRVNNRVPSH